MATLRDLGSELFESAPAGAGPVTAPGDRWVVLAGAAGPVCAIAPATSLAVGDRPAGILLAAADMDLGEALESAAFEQFADVTALVLTEPDEDRPGQPRVAGVVSGETLARMMLRGPTRGTFGWGSTGSGLAGVPDVALIAWSCGYLEAGTRCRTRMEFETKPSASMMPACPNKRGLAAHQFDW
jgi:hypothetical protein